MRQNFRMARQTLNANFSNSQNTPIVRTPIWVKNNAKMQIHGAQPA